MVKHGSTWFNIALEKKQFLKGIRSVRGRYAHWMDCHMAFPLHLPVTYFSKFPEPFLFDIWIILGCNIPDSSQGKTRTTHLPPVLFLTLWSSVAAMSFDLRPKRAGPRPIWSMDWCKEYIYRNPCLVPTQKRGVPVDCPSYHFWEPGRDLEDLSVKHHGNRQV